ncbi:cupin-like domain-containing protein [Phycomyces nitens]|nr:cupin-like domain-containing protein [Phycomyces nitens]
MPAMEECFERYVKEYQEMCGSHVHVYPKPPTALEFLRTSVHPNRPAVIKGAFDNWPARTKWTNEYLRSAMGKAPVTVAITPNGYADAVTVDQSTAKEYFAMPYEKIMPFDQFIDIMESKDTVDKHYISLQNGSLPVEFSALEKDVAPHIDWCTDALGKQPDAVNFWFGDSKSITSLHKDPYENCYAVIRGQKTFVLFPPSEYYCMHESLYPGAIYQPNPTTGKLELVPVDPPTKTPWIPVDPLCPDYLKYPRFRNAKPLVISVQEGDMLYLPALWFHHVLQDGDKGVIAVNYWYDMEYTNSLFPTMGLFRDLVAGVLDGIDLHPNESDSDSDSE